MKRTDFLSKKSLLFFSLMLVLINVKSQKDHTKRNVAIFIYNQVEVLDFTGPGEVFSKAKTGKGEGFNVYTVAATIDEITSNGFLKIKPNYSIDDCPKPDIIVLPGGNSEIPMNNEKVIQWIKNSSNDKPIMMSVCTGAFLLAKAGLLDGLQATTHYCCQDDLRKKFPKVVVKKDKRFIDNGNIITTEGISAGIDGSLHLLARFYGMDVAKQTAHYMMYNWKPEMYETGDGSNSSTQ